MTNLRIAVAAALAAAALAPSAQAATVEAFANATVQPAGPRPGSSGLAFFNVEGANNGSFASYGVARFDLAALKAGFDAQYGAGGWQIDSVALSLTQSNAAFTANGGVEIFYTGNDTVSLVAPSPLTYGGFAADFADAQSVLGYTFTQIGDGTVETYTLYDRSGSNGAGAAAVAADMLADGLLTLALRETSPGVAATYAGHDNFSWAGPTLTVLASAVPEPGTWALLAAGLGVAGTVLRRRG